MLKAWLTAALCSAAFAETVTYNYTGNSYTVCNGTTSINGSCPANSFIDHSVASLTFSAPLGSNLSNANEVSSPNLLGWTIGDSLGNIPTFASTDPNAAAEITGTGVANFQNGISLSTNSSGAITGWTMEASNAEAGAGIFSPTFIGGSGFPTADAIVGNVSGVFWHLGNGFTGTWTETLNGLQGGSSSAPVFLLGGSPIAGVSGSIGGQGAEEYYGFYWAGGAFSATASIATSDGSYLFTEGNAGSFCSGGASETLNSGDSFTNTIAIANLAPGQYCIGIENNGIPDPGFAMTFNTPVSGVVPEPSSLIPLSLALGIIGFIRRAKHLGQ
jgi:hypothetical protein